MANETMKDRFNYITGRLAHNFDLRVRRQGGNPGFDVYFTHMTRMYMNHQRGFVAERAQHELSTRLAHLQQMVPAHAQSLLRNALANRLQQLEQAIPARAQSRVQTELMLAPTQGGNN